MFKFILFIVSPVCGELGIHSVVEIFMVPRVVAFHWIQVMFFLPFHGPFGLIFAGRLAIASSMNLCGNLYGKYGSLWKYCSCGSHRIGWPDS